MIREAVTSAKIPQRWSKYMTSAAMRMTPWIVGVGVWIALGIGFLQRDEERITPKYGTGYWLGILGGCAMLLLLFYSYRKRKPRIRGVGSVPAWFRIHMFLGVFGPVLVIFHTNFRLGALNSNVALFTMLTVAGSGVIGRYIYGKIHIGLYGRKAEAKEIFADIAAMSEELGADLPGMTDVVSELKEIGRRTIESGPSTPVSSLVSGGVMSVKSRLMRRSYKARVRSLLTSSAPAAGWTRADLRRHMAEADAKIDAYFAAILKAMELRFFERLFSLWHLLHLPLFSLMLAAGLIHVWAVHRY
jgi:hypothetical protein